MNELVQILKNTRQHLMTGVSHMIPFVVSGGILLAVSVMLYGKPRFYVSTSKSIIKALINMHSFEIQLSPIG